MYGLTRATLTLLGAGVAGFLIWLGSRIAGDSPSGGEFWAFAGLAAAAGLVMALSQLLGGWTKWGWPRVSGNVFLFAFLPTLIVGGWIVASGEPSGYWLGDHIRNWSNDIGVDGAVNGLRRGWTAIAFGIGLVFGLSFDTTGPRVKREPVPAGEAQPGNGKPADERRVHIREGATPAAPQPEPAPRSGEPAKK